MDDSWSVAILGAIAAWAVTGMFTFYWKRKHLRRAVAEDIVRQQQRIALQQEYLSTFSSKWLVAQKVVNIGTYYEPTDQSVFRELLSQLVQYSPGALERVILFHEAIRMVDALLTTFWTDVRRDKEQTTLLDDARVAYYTVKSDRIYAYTRALTSFNGSNLSELPHSYKVADAVDILKKLETSRKAADI
jgi:hypothetical protein